MKHIPLFSHKWMGRPLIWLLVWCLVATTAMGQSRITLQFNRTGTTADAVGVSVLNENGEAIPNVTARLLSTSHALRASQNAITSAILCPNVNANTNPTIQLTFALSGLPEGFQFDCVGMDIHALNAAGNYQSSSDNVTRHFNVAIAQGTDEANLSAFASLTNIDVAAGVSTNGQTHKVWEARNGNAVTAAGDHIIRLTVTKGTTNGGCFFGLSALTLGMWEAPVVEPYEPIFQVYKWPCGMKSAHYIAQAEISGEGVQSPLHYPLPNLVGGQVQQGMASAPASWFEIFTKDCAVVNRGGEMQLRIHLNAAPETGETLHAYFDWNCDGAFEGAQQLDIQQDLTTTITVPDTAKVGQTRLRLRLNLNGLDDSNDDVYGEILDLQLRIADAPETGTITARPNHPSRGKVSVTASAEGEVTLKATPLGNARFLGWKEGHEWVSTQSEWAVAVTGNRTFVAVFSVNTDTTVGIALPTTPSAATARTIYDLSGRRLATQPEHGVFIQNGQKHIK